MSRSSVRVVVCLWVLMLAAAAEARQSVAPASASVPRVVRVDGTFVPANGQPAAAVETVSLAIYAGQADATPLWEEVQEVRLDAQGRYAVFLGATSAEGVPIDVLAGGAERWFGVRFARPGEQEQPRVLLTSVPYALRASDADTLGGWPASAFLRAPETGTGSTTSDGSASGAARTAGATSPRVSTGTANFIGKFTNAVDLTSSAMFESSGRVGINTTSPFDILHARFTDTTGGITGLAVQNLGSSAGSYSGMLFYDQNGALGQFQGFNNATHEYRINNIAPGGSINFMLGSTPRFTVNSGGIGVGTITPQDTLDISAGWIRSGSGLRMFGSGQYSGVSEEAGNQLVNFGINDGRAGTFSAANYGGFFRVDTRNSNEMFQWWHKVTGIETMLLSLSATGDLNLPQGNAVIRKAGTSFVHGRGLGNAALGLNALAVVTTGAQNTAVGQSALGANVVGGSNVAVGSSALAATPGSFNTALGALALSQTTGDDNTAVGFGALFQASGTANIALGKSAGSNVSAGTGNILIGHPGGNENNTIRLGQLQTRLFGAGIRGVTTGAADAVTVVIDSNGQLGTINSSRRYKEDIQDMGEASSGLMQLRPVTYRYTQAYADGSKPIDYGLIAEEVQQVYPELVTHLASGDVETVQYHKVNAMLLNEVQKQQRRILSLEDELREFRARVASLEQFLQAAKR